jgi:hypothetical protein
MSITKDFGGNHYAARLYSSIEEISRTIRAVGPAKSGTQSACRPKIGGKRSDPEHWEQRARGNQTAVGAPTAIACNLSRRRYRILAWTSALSPRLLLELKLVLIGTEGTIHQN